MSIDSAVSNIPNTGAAPDANVDAQRVTPPSIADQSQNLSSQDSRNAISQNGPTQNVAQPQAPKPQPQPAEKSMSPAEIHQSLFKKVFEGLGGGPTKVIVQNPVTGEMEQQVRHMTKKGIGASILAGAISGMLAGISAPDKRTEDGRQDLSSSAQAGAQAGQAMVQKRNQNAQNLEDEKAGLGRHYQTMKQNLDLHSMALSVNKLQGESLDSAISSADPIIKGLALSKMPDGTDAIAGQHENEAALMKRIKESGGHITRDSALPDGKQDMIGPDGKPIPLDPQHPEYGNKQELTWTSFDNRATLKITAEMKKEHPELVHVLDGQSAPVRAIAQYYINKGNTTIVNHSIDDVIKKQQEMSGDKKKIELSWDKIKKEHPSFGAYEAQMVGLAGLDPDQYVDAAMKINPQIGAILQQELGVNKDEWNSKREEAKKDADKEAAIKSLSTPEARITVLGDKAGKYSPELHRQAQEMQDADRAEKQRISDMELEKEKKLAAYKKQIGLADNGETVSANKSYSHEWVDPKTGNHWNLSEPATSMVEGDTDPTQLSKKSKDYNQKLTQANEYSFARYGKNFDLAQAQIDFKEAQNPTVRSTLRYLNSLTGNDNKSGNLGALVQYSDKYARTTFTSLNDVNEWVRNHANDPTAIKYGTAVTETADQVAKILQGGGSGNGTSDAKLKQAQDLFAKGFSGSEIAAVAETLRNLLANRKNEMVHGNRYLAKQFPEIAADKANSSQFTKFSSDGKWAWNGKAWVAAQ